MKNFRLRCSRWFLPICLALILGGPQLAMAAPVNPPVAVQYPVPTSTPTHQTGGAAADLEEAARAVVQIVAVGNFVDPAKGARTYPGSGSGFIIDPSGLAVTNNHVVTGAAFLKVHLPGETKFRSAKVLGVDECADLAVIDIDGNNFPYLAWSSAALKVGTPVYAAGYPLGDPEYTLTSGIIGKAKANGQTPWASLDYTLQHDATLNPGNSGGPLLDQAGQVIGINYAGYAEANQYFAISNELARPIIEQLRSGIDLNTIGLSARALSDGKTFAGVWVTAVRSGSPADQTGVRPGDFILRMEGVPIGVEGTLETYCNILRSHDAQDVISLQVQRNQGEIWEGQLNGRPLQLVATSVAPTVPTATTATAQPGMPLTPTPTPTLTPTPEPTVGANPALVEAITAVGWDLANGHLQIAPDAVITATVEKDENQNWGYPLVSGATEYALYYKVAFGSNGDVCYSSLGLVAPKPTYTGRWLSFQLIRAGAESRFRLLGWDWVEGGKSQGEDVIANTSPVIQLGKGQFNEVVITVHEKVITVYVNGEQLMQYTSTGFLETGSLSLHAWAPTSNPQVPNCVFRDVQWFLPN